MKHWDLIPGERVRLGRSPFTPMFSDTASIEAVFRFRSTLLACFEPVVRLREGPRLLEFELVDDGGLRDHHGRVYIAGEDRNTRTQIQQEVSAGRHFTRTDRRALKGR